MQNPRLASRYAKSVLDLAVEQNSLDTMLKDMQLLDSICKESVDFTNMLRSPVIKGDKKRTIVHAVLADRVSKLSLAFIDLLISKGREANLPEIAPAFISQYKEMKKIKTVKLTTAVPVNDSLKQTILNKVSGTLAGNTVDLHTAVDPELIGGFVLEMEDRLFDASVLRDLKDVKAQFLDNSYISSI